MMNNRQFKEKLKVDIQKKTEIANFVKKNIKEMETRLTKVTLDQSKAKREYEDLLSTIEEGKIETKTKTDLGLKRIEALQESNRTLKE